MTVSPGGAIPRGILTGADSPPRPLAAALLSENRAFILWGGRGEKEPGSWCAGKGTETRARVRRSLCPEKKGATEWPRRAVGDGLCH